MLELDILRKDDGFVTKVYRKKTHTQKYIHWRSNHPKECLIGVMKGLIHRAYQLCDLQEDLKEELDLLRDVFISNGYPIKIVEKTIKEYVPKTGNQKMEDLKEKAEDLEKEKEGSSQLYVPYVPGFSDRMQRELRKMNINLVFRKGNTLYNEICKLKLPRPRDESKNVVYVIKCRTCDTPYIGESCQTFKARRSQHKSDVRRRVKTNGIYQHLKANRRHKIDWEDASFLDKEEHWHTRKLKESLYINAMNPAKEISEVMNLDKGYALNQCWDEFLSEIRGAMRV